MLRDILTMLTFIRCTTEPRSRGENINIFNRYKKSLKIPKGQSESVYRRTDNTMAKRKSTKGQTTIYKTYT